ncbi:MAG: sulfurtransferase [Geobacter sp.]|nr:sulfurtransferase [Geobacter sp.]
MNATISCTELQLRLDAGGPLLIIDILPPEEYAATHLPGALNACVYEVVFLDRMAELAPDRSLPLVLYDATGRTRAAVIAREKLVAAGYREVHILEGGLAGWCAAGYQIAQAGEPLREPQLMDGTYRIDATASVLEWTGRNINNRHYGRVPLQEGELVITGGGLRQGSVTLDMTGIINLDLKNEGYRQMLVNHLKSEDFFDVARYPVATMVLKGWEPIPEASPGTPDHLVRGELTIKGVTRPLTLPATVMPQEDGSVKAQALFAFDRTDWNITYGSGKLFEKLGMHLVHDRIDIELFFVARRVG